MKALFRIHLVGLFFSCSSPSLFAADTLLYNSIELPHTVVNIVVDEEGRLYYGNKIGTYELHKDGRSELINSGYQDELLIDQGQLYFIKDRERDYAKIQQYWDNQDLGWNDKVNNFNLNYRLSSAKDGQWVWVAFKNYIYQFLILESAEIHLLGHSTRVLQIVDSNLVAGTYKGLFLNNELVDFCHFDGFVYSNEENVYVGSGAHIYKLHLDGAYVTFFKGDLDFLSSAPTHYLNFTSLYEKPDNTYFIGTDKGLLELDSNWNFVQFDLEDLVVEYIGVFGNDFWICTSGGMYSWNRQRGFSKLDLKDIEAPNHFYLTDKRLFIAASNSFFEFSIDDSLISKPKKIQFEDDLIEFYRIEEGKPGEFWVSSDKGLHLYKAESGLVQSIYEDFEFNKRASFNAFPTIYFGGLFGVLEIDAVGLSEELNDIFPKNSGRGQSADFKQVVIFLVLGMIIIAIVFFQIRKKKQNFITPQTEAAASKSLDLDNPLDLKIACQQVINQNLSTITVELLSQKLEINGRTLNRRLSIIGMSAGELIREQRLKVITQELQASDEIDIDRISKLTGYSEVHLNSLIKSLQGSPKS